MFHCSEDARERKQAAELHDMWEGVQEQVNSLPPPSDALQRSEAAPVRDLPQELQLELPAHGASAAAPEKRYQGELRWL
jgi:hypothetical protein